jgi:hypothetical protein
MVQKTDVSNDVEIQHRFFSCKKKKDVGRKTWSKLKNQTMLT